MVHYQTYKIMVPTSKGQIWKSALQDILSQTAIYKALTNTILTSKNPVKGIKKYADRGRVIHFQNFRLLDLAICLQEMRKDGVIGVDIDSTYHIL